MAKIGFVAYKLELPATAKIHLVFHISQLKAFHGPTTTHYLPLPLTTSELGPILQPEAILDSRIILKGTAAFNLEDEVTVNGGRIARPPRMERGPQNVESAAERIKLVTDSEFVEARRSPRNKVPSTRLKDYKTRRE